MTSKPKSPARPKNTDFIDAFNQEHGLESDDIVEDKSGAEDFAKLLGESLKSEQKKLKVGEKVIGKILSLGQEDVFVSTGTRHDGIISRRELLDAEGNCPFQQGDLITLYITQIRGGEIRLSRNSKEKGSTKDLEEAYSRGLGIQGRIAEVCKGGVRVNIKGKLAFCPISQIDIAHVENPEEYVGKSFEFRITQYAEDGRNIVVSRKKLLEEARDTSTNSFLEDHKDGDVVQGKVMRLEKFGAFVELAPGVDGLVHISEIAWSRIGDPSEILQTGQEVTVKILKREVIHGRVKISLSIKQTMQKEDKPKTSGGPTIGTLSENADKADPWSKYMVGQIHTGKVTKKELFGLFIQLEPGITGLLHKSKTLDAPQFQLDKIKVGDALTVQIGQISLGERKISLEPPRDPHEDDWKEHKQGAISFGSLGDQLKASMAKKKS